MDAQEYISDDPRSPLAAAIATVYKDACLRALNLRFDDPENEEAGRSYRVLADAIEGAYPQLFANNGR